MSQTRAVTIYMCALAVVAALVLMLSPLADWLKWAIGSGVGGVVVAILLLQAIQSLRQTLHAIDDGEY